MTNDTQNVIHGTHDFVDTDAAKTFLSTKNFELRHAGNWPWVSDTNLVRARIVVGRRGYRIEYKLSRELLP
jgi:hypothetical protein